MENKSNNNYMCFACSPSNPIGLKLEFSMDGDICRSSFTAGPNHQGWTGYVHGGIISTLMDEVMAQWTYMQGIWTMTAEITIRLSQAVPINVPLTIEAIRTGGKGKLHLMEARLVLPGGAVACRASAKFLTVPKDNILSGTIRPKTGAIER